MWSYGLCIFVQSVYLVCLEIIHNVHQEAQFNGIYFILLSTIHFVHQIKYIDSII